MLICPKACHSPYNSLQLIPNKFHTHTVHTHTPSCSKNTFQYYAPIYVYIFQLILSHYIWWLKYCKYSFFQCVLTSIRTWIWQRNQETYTKFYKINSKGLKHVKKMQLLALSKLWNNTNCFVHNILYVPWNLWCHLAQKWLYNKLWKTHTHTHTHTRLILWVLGVMPQNKMHHKIGYVYFMPTDKTMFLDFTHIGVIIAFL